MSKPPRKKATFDTGPEIDYTPTLDETLVRVKKLRENNETRRVRDDKIFTTKMKIMEMKVSINKMKTVNKGVGSKHPKAKLTATNVRAIRRALAKGATTSTLAVAYGVSGMIIHRIKHGLAYKDVL